MVAVSTKVAYSADFETFRHFCRSNDLLELPATPSTVIAFLEHTKERGSAKGSLIRCHAAIHYMHKTAGHESPTNFEIVRTALRRICRTIHKVPEGNRQLSADHIKAMVRSTPDSIKGCRDRAILQLLYVGALWRSQLVAIDVSDLQEDGSALKIVVGYETVNVMGEAADAIKVWRTEAGISQGPLFRAVAKGGRISGARLTDKVVNDLIKAYAEKIGLDASLFTATSIRLAGEATTYGAARKRIRSGKRSRNIMDEMEALDVFKSHMNAFEYMEE